MKRLLLSLMFISCISVAYGQNNPVCPNSAMVSSVTSTTILVNTPPRALRICSVIFNVVQGASAVNFGLVSGTGAACGGSTSNVSMRYTGVASSTQAYTQAVDYSIAWTAPAVQLCLYLSGAPTSASAQVFYGYQ